MEKISRTKIVDLLKCRDFGAMVNVKGWVRTRRGSKQVNFIALNDGSTINNVQIVVDLANFDEEMLKQITTGACISVNGELTESIGSGQAAEVQARGIEVLGTCDNTYPLQKKGHTMEFLREIAHLRPRTNTFGAVNLIELFRAGGGATGSTFLNSSCFTSGSSSCDNVVTSVITSFCFGVASFTNVGMLNPTAAIITTITIAHV